MFKLEGFKRKPYCWSPLEQAIGFSIPNTYKEFYETIGALGIDDYIYIVNTTNCDSIDGLYDFNSYVYDVYLHLEKYLEKEQIITFFNGRQGWLPIGYTTSGDFIFCDPTKVMVTDSGFEEREIYEKTLLEFIQMYLTDKLKFTVLSESLVGEKHTIEILK